MGFMIHEIFFNGQPKRIAFRDTKEESALTSISNYLSLMGIVSIDDSDGPLKEKLEGMVINFALGLLRLRKKSVTTDQNISLGLNVYSILRRICNGIHVNPVLNSVDKFDSTPEYTFFNCMDIPLYHCNMSSTEILSVQLKHGSGRLGVLYSNEEFFTMYKHNGVLCILIEDKGLHMEQPDAVWKTLNMVDGAHILLTSNFAPAGICIKCQHGGCCRDFNVKMNHQRHYFSHLSNSKINELTGDDIFDLQMFWDQISIERACSILSAGKQTVEKYLGSPVDIIIGNWVRTFNFRLAPSELKVIVNDLKLILKRNTKPSCKELVDFLNVATEGTFLCTNILKETVTLEKANEIDDAGTMLAYFCLGIEKEWVKQWHDDRTTKALEISENLLSEGKVSATTAASEETDTHLHVSTKDEDASASEETNMDNHPNAPDTPSETARLKIAWSKRKLLPSEIGHLPTLHDGEEYFPIFVHRNKMVRLYDIFSDEKAIALTRIGRKTAKRLLSFILRIHKEGQCWHGNFHILDVRVQMRGAELIIAKEAEPATSDGMYKDLQQFIVELIPYYQIEGIGDPAFFDAFHADVMECPDPESKEFDLFQKFVAHHLAFMPQLARSGLFENLFRVCDSLCVGSRGVVGEAPGWRKKVKFKQVFKEVYFHPEGSGADTYTDSRWELLRFVRNFINRAYKYSKVHGVEKVMDIVGYELMISNELGDFMSEILLNLIYDCNMEGRFKSLWMAFITSDDESVEIDEDGEN